MTIGRVVACFAFLACWTGLVLSGSQSTSAAETGPQGGAPRDVLAQAPKPGTPDAFELSFWETIKNSKNPEDFRAYLEAYPNGKFAALARVRAKAAAAPAAPPGPPPTTGPATTTPPTTTGPAATTTPAQTEELLPVEPMDADYVATDAAIVRVRPSNDAARLGNLDRGEKVRVTGKLRSANWLRIVRPSGQIGFVPGDFLEPNKAGGGVGSAGPSIAPPSTGTPQPQDAETDCPDCPEMVPIKPGNFEMGSTEFFEFEKPVHTVAIRKPFLIGRREVTLREWERCADEGACLHRIQPGTDPNQPVTDVSWADAKAYAAWLAQKTGKPYRLPTEAEWEYAARGGTTTTYYWGRQLVKERANCAGCNAENRRKATGAGSFPPNDFGLFDMAGNAAEWVEDCWTENYRGAPADGSAWVRPGCRERVLRGGSFVNDPRYVRSAARFKYEAEVRYYGNGFRVARDQ